MLQALARRCISVPTFQHVPAIQVAVDPAFAIAREEAARLAVEIRDLQRGKGIFAGLTHRERADVLAPFGLIPTPPTSSKLEDLHDDELIEVMSDPTAPDDVAHVAGRVLLARIAGIDPSRTTVNERDDVEARLGSAGVDAFVAGLAANAFGYAFDPMA